MLVCYYRLTQNWVIETKVYHNTGLKIRTVSSFYKATYTQHKNRLLCYTYKFSDEWWIHSMLNKPQLETETKEWELKAYLRKEGLNTNA